MCVQVHTCLFTHLCMTCISWHMCDCQMTTLGDSPYLPFVGSTATWLLIAAILTYVYQKHLLSTSHITIGGPGIQMCGSHSAWRNKVYGNSNSSSPACKAFYAVSHLPRSALHFRKGSTSLLMCFQNQICRGTVEHSLWLSSVSVEGTNHWAGIAPKPLTCYGRILKSVHQHWTYGSHVNIGTV